MFGDTPRRAWWANVLRPGYRHVWAVCWYAEEQRWVYFNPALTGTEIAIFTEEQFPAKLGILLEHSTAVLRVASRYGRGAAPAVPWCVGAIKSLLGIRCAALTPWRLYHALVARGAEVVETSCVAANSEDAAPSAA
jgi:hypothetical protein